MAMLRPWTPPSTSQSTALTAIRNGTPLYDGYQPLDDARREIRLLEIGPGLRCTLYHTELDSRPQYYALSYYWGAPGRALPITVNGTEVQLRLTLHRFFEELQQRYGQLTVWVDALCINQRDRVEQSRQVAMMGDVYKTASSVYAWLGEGNTDSNFAFDCVTTFGLDEDQEDRPTGVHQYLKGLLTRPYFSRAWIVQECALNKHLLVFCGNRCASWNSLISAHNDLERREAKNTYLCAPYSTTDPTIHAFRAIISLQATPQESRASSRQRLQEIILAFKDSGCMDPRDKVYAFLSLVPEDGRIRVDYTKAPIDALFQALSTPFPALSSRDFIDTGSQMLLAMSLMEDQVLGGLLPAPGDSFILLLDLTEHGLLSQFIRFPSAGDLCLAPWPKTSDNNHNLESESMIAATPHRPLAIYRAANPISPNLCLVRRSRNIDKYDWFTRDWESKSLGEIYPEKMRRLKEELNGRFQLCTFRPVQDSLPFRSLRLPIHLDRVASLALIALSTAKHHRDYDCVPQSLFDYARANPPAPEDAACRCRERYKRPRTIEHDFGSYVASDLEHKRHSPRITPSYDERGHTKSLLQRWRMRLQRK